MHPVVAELRALVRLATPIATARVGFLLLSIVDTAFVGRLGETSLGAVGIANSLFYLFVVFGGGIVMGIEPLVSQALGAGEDEVAVDALWQGLWLSLLVSLPLCALAAASTMLFAPIGVEDETGRQATVYLLARLPAIPLLNLFTAMRSYLEARHVTRPLVIGVVVANVLNVPGNLLLVFGDAGLSRIGLPAVGMPALGIVGAGITSTAVTIVQVAIVALALRAEPHTTPRRPWHGAVATRALRIGGPVGLQRVAELGLFSATGLLMARLGTRAVASHQVVFTLVSGTFMVPLGISAAAAVRVGRAVGAGDPDGARRSGLVAAGATTACMVGSAALFLALPRTLAGLLTDERAVIEAAAALLAIGALFQVSDGLQVVASGALRGLGDTRVPLHFNLAGFYGVGLTLGVYLAFFAHQGAPGLWWGLLAGLSAVAAALSARFLYLSKRSVVRI